MRLRSLAALCLAFAALTLLLAASSCQSGALSADGERNVIRRSMSTDPKTLDPHKAGDVESSTQCGLVYEQLFEYHFFDRPARVIPSLAAEMPVITENGTLYTIKMRDDVFFQDSECFPGGKGRKMVASDVVYSIKRFASLSDTPGWWIADGKIVGLDAFRGFATSATAGITDESAKATALAKALEREVSGLTANDETGIVTIKLTESDPRFIATNCMSYFAVVPHEAVDYYGESFFQNPVGTGPFRLKQWDFKKDLVWERNPTYRKEVYPEVPANHQAKDGAVEAEHYKPFVGKTLPLADEIRFRIIPEGQASWLEFLQGNLDVSGIESDQFASAVQNDSLTPKMVKKGIQLIKYDRPIIEYLVFNMNDPKWGTAGGEKAAAVRKAVALSFNREHYIENVLNGRGTVANMLVTPQFVGYSANYDYPYSHYNPEEGRKILEAAGFKITKGDRDGEYKAIDPDTGEQPRITFLCRGTSDASKKTAKQLIYSGPRVGIDIQAENILFPEFLQRQNDGEGQAYNAGWVFDYPDAQNILVLLYGKNAVPAGVNSARYKSPEFDALYDQMYVLDQNDPAQAKQKEEIIVEMHKILERDCPWALIYFGKTYQLYHQWYSPSMPNDFAYGLYKYYGANSVMRTEKAEEWRDAPILPGLIMGVLALAFASLFIFKVLLQR